MVESKDLNDLSDKILNKLFQLFWFQSIFTVFNFFRMALEFIKSEKNQLRLVHNGFLFYRDKKTEKAQAGVVQKIRPSNVRLVFEQTMMS